jgi:hypothetical protein
MGGIAYPGQPLSACAPQLVTGSVVAGLQPAVGLGGVET